MRSKYTARSTSSLIITCPTSTTASITRKCENSRPFRSSARPPAMTSTASWLTTTFFRGYPRRVRSILPSFTIRLTLTSDCVPARRRWTPGLDFPISTTISPNGLRTSERTKRAPRFLTTDRARNQIKSRIIRESAQCRKRKKKRAPRKVNEQDWGRYPAGNLPSAR